MSNVSQQSHDVRLAVLEERIARMEMAIELQAKEYKRRLVVLNHAHEKQVSDQATFVSSERYEGWQGEVNAWRAQVTKTLAELDGRGIGAGSARSLFFQVVPLLISIGALVAVLWK